MESARGEFHNYKSINVCNDEITGYDFGAISVIPKVQKFILL